MSIRNRYRNTIRLPVILFFVLTGVLITSRWIKEVKAHNLQNKLSIQLRQLNHDCIKLQRDINDLEGRETALLTADALDHQLAMQGVVLEKADNLPVISLTPSLDSQTRRVAQQQSVTP